MDATLRTLREIEDLVAAASRNQGTRPNTIIMPAVGPASHVGVDMGGGDHHRIGGRTAGHLIQNIPNNRGGGFSILDTWTDPPHEL
jgi:hypothetical protein